MEDGETTAAAKVSAAKKLKKRGKVKVDSNVALLDLTI